MKQLFIFLALFPSLVHSEVQNAWKLQFHHSLTEIRDASYNDSPSPEILSDSEKKASSRESAIAAVAIVNLWLSNRQNTVELYWWKQRNRSVRTLVIALYYCATIEPISGIPPFPVYANRFSDEEAAERLEEIDFVEKHLSAIAKILSKTTGGIARSKVIHNRYLHVAGSNIGQPLPKPIPEAGE